MSACCTADLALFWMLSIAADALDGDADAMRCLAAAVDHYLAAVRREGVRRGQ
ncbi:MAG: hypothetical protein WBF66_04455 [Dehalococcoidia bacterium]